MGLLAVSLLGFGTGNFGGGRTASLGTVGGLEVPTQAYANAVTRQLRDIGDQVGQPITLAEARELGLDIDRQALAGLVTQRVLDAEAARLGLSIGDARVAEAVRTTQAFQGLDGQFDRTVYRDQLDRIGLSEAEYEDGLREDTARTILQAAVLGGVPEPRTVARTLAAWQGERRVVTWAELPSATVAATLPTPTDADLQAWYEAHPERYTAPEQRQIAYAWVTPEMIQDGMEVDESALRDLYEERRADYVQEERRLVERLVFADAEAAADGRARLDAGDADFEALVEERGLALSDIDLGDVSRGDLGAAADPVFAAQQGGVVGPLDTDLGPALFRVNAVLAADETTFEEAEPELRAELSNEAARRAIADEVGRLEDLAAGGATVEDLAEQTLLEPGTLAWSEGVTEGPAAYEAFRVAAQAATEGAFPEVIELGDGGIAVLRLDGVTAPALRPFAEVADQVAVDLRADSLQAATLAEAARQAEAIATGASFEDQGLAPRTESPRTRRDLIEGAPPGTVAAAFEMAPGTALALPSPAGAIVLRLDVIEAAPADDPRVLADEDNLARQVSGAMAQDIFDAFARELQMGTEVRIDDAVVQAITAQIQ